MKMKEMNTMNAKHELFLLLAGALAVGLTAPVIASSNDSPTKHWNALPAPGVSLPVSHMGEQPRSPETPPIPLSERGLCDGFPVYLNTPSAGFPYTPTLFDVTGDGAAEIFLTGGETFGLRGDGSFLPGWPTQEHQHMGYGTNSCKPGPSVADLQGDGNVEILWTQRDWWAGSSHMWTFNGRRVNGQNLPGFPQYAPDGHSNALDTAFVLGDTTGDGNLEAWGAHTLGNNFTHYRISAFDHTGERLFTTDLDPAENIISLYFGDLDGDGVPEMFAVSFLSPNLYLYAFNPDGSVKAGYPVHMHTVTNNLPFGPPIPFDLNGDGSLEILFGIWGGGQPSYALCVDHTGEPCAGFPIQIETSSQLFYLGLGDITGNGKPELLALDNHLGSAYRAIAIDMDTGTMLPGWPLSVPNWPKGFPCVADITGDGEQNVIFATDGGMVYALHSDGTVVDGYPLTMAASSIATVAIGDIDGDGLFEIVATTWNGYVYAWNTPAPARHADWPMRGVDARNTGVYYGRPACPEDLDGDGFVGHADLAILLAAYGSAPGDPNWNPDADINGDGQVGHADLAMLLAMYGQPCP